LATASAAPSQVPSAALARSSPASKKKSVRLTLWPLVAATFFMVSGGTYGIEDIVHGAGYGRAILFLVLTPLLWSLPTAFMIGELSSALPFEGGYYAWVRRAMGNFWGFQEAWLSLTASVFDMAIYPTLFTLYLTRLFPWFGVNHRGLMVALAVVIVCALLNIAGVKVVSTTSLWLFFALSSPFLLVVVLSLLQATLTLPGIAAIALALGMAIDANVLINERVREELRNGAPPQLAIQNGYAHAWATILDSNVTTLIAGVALLAFGSGPVRGFAIVHCIGILTSMFSAVFFSRGIVNLWYGGKKKLKSLAIGQVWRPETAAAASAAYLGNELSADDAATDTAQAMRAASAAAAAKQKAPAAAAQSRAGKPTVRRRNAPGTPSSSQKPGSSR